MATGNNNSGIRRIAPYVCAAVLAGAFAFGGFTAPTPKGSDEYRARVRLALDRVPYKIGPAVGIDVEPTRAAIQLLTPNKIFQRQYVDPGTGWAQSLLIVHCSNSRDMTGHYPPICYPAHGWNTGSAEEMSMVLNGASTRAMLYRFSRTEDLVQRRMSVIDFFVIPEAGGMTFADMDEMGRTARSSKIGGLGVAQVQIVFDEEASPQWREMMVRETLQAIGPAVQVIEQGVSR